MGLWCQGKEAFVRTIQSFAQAKIAGSEGTPRCGDVVVLDLQDDDARKCIQKWVASECQVLVACDPHKMTDVVEAVQMGASKVLSKPVSLRDLQEFVEVKEVEQEDVQAWREKYAGEILGNSEAINEALEMAMAASDVDCPVLITGESGTGKELLARALHRASQRAGSACVPVNCPAIPKELVESELFGHSKGAFTGATNARVGRFAAANGGTLFLDEIGEMDLNIQSKLLRVLQDFEITPVGESRSQRVDVRVIAATNRDLEEMSEKGGFREDLYYRLNVVQIHLPPLRERRGDIPMLIDSLLALISDERKLPAPILTDEVRDALIAYRWPGNVRQLRNVLERLVILRRGKEVTLSHLPTCVTRAKKTEEGADAASFELPEEGMDLRRALQRFEETMIRKALLQTEGNKNQAAKILGLNRTTLVEKLRKRPIAVAS
jgi:DNA-binding NtrC family response regulator